MPTEEAKITLLGYTINSIENGSLDENLQAEITACIVLAKTLKNPFEKHLYLTLLNDMVKERLTIKRTK
jgi:DNA-binding XRE family transcriptional regulator